jgi:hypothetical protein
VGVLCVLCGKTALVANRSAWRARAVCEGVSLSTEPSATSALWALRCIRVIYVPAVADRRLHLLGLA